MGWGGEACLLPGADYEIHEEGGGRLAAARAWSACPAEGAGGRRSEEDYAKRVLLLFCPWTSHPDDASAAAPFLADLCKFGKSDWRRALRRRLILRGFPTEEVKQFALNFCFVYCLPRELRPEQHLQENSDNEVQDEGVRFDKADLEVARATHVRGAGKLGSENCREQDSGLVPGRVEEERGRHLARPRRACRAAQRKASSSSTTTRLPGPPAPRGARADFRPFRASAKPGGIPRRTLGPPVTAHALLDERVRSGLNRRQWELLRVVVERVLVELELAPPDHKRPGSSTGRWSRARSTPSARSGSWTPSGRSRSSRSRGRSCR